MNTFALIGDIIESKKIKERYNIQQKLETKLQELNYIFKEDIKSALTITLGDEFQGLFCNVETLLLCIDIISTYFKPLGITFRFGIGYGKMLTKVNPNISIGSDGEPYWYARQALVEIETTKNSSQVYEKMIIKNSSQDIINSLLMLQGKIRNDWTIEQSKLIYLILMNSGYKSINTEMLLNDFDYTRQRISNLISRSSFHHYSETRINLFNYIKEVIK